MNKYEKIALGIIAEGRLVEDHWHDEGDGESGPMGGSLFGYRTAYGDTVTLSSNGSVFLEREEDENCHVIYNSSSSVGSSTAYTGVGAMIADHLKACKRNAERNGIDFVRTGVRPTEGHYSLDAIMEREEAMRS